MDFQFEINKSSAFITNFNNRTRSPLLFAHIKRDPSAIYICTVKKISRHQHKPVEEVEKNPCKFEKKRKKKELQHIKMPPKLKQGNLFSFFNKKPSPSKAVEKLETSTKETSLLKSNAKATVSFSSSSYKREL